MEYVSWIWDADISYSDSNTSVNMDVDYTIQILPVSDSQQAVSLAAKILLAMEIC